MKGKLQISNGNKVKNGFFIGNDLHGILFIQFEQRQNRNVSIQSTIIPILKLPGGFPHCIGGEKERHFQSWNYFLLNGVLLILSWL